MRLEIPEPCHESWGKMTPKEKGRFCDKCCKVVVDFTNMPTPEVIQFIAERKSERVCGRFRHDQVAVPPAPVVRKSISDRVKQFLAAIFLVFGGALFSGCHEEKVGKIAAYPQHSGFTQPDTLKPKNVVPAPDTTQQKQEFKGKVKCVEPLQGQAEIIDLGMPVILEKEPLLGKPSFTPGIDSAE